MVVVVPSPEPLSHISFSHYPIPLTREEKRKDRNPNHSPKHTMGRALKASFMSYF
jgi:hypothetical protein